MANDETNPNVEKLQDCHPERSAAESKDPEALPKVNAAEFLDFALGITA